MTDYMQWKTKKQVAAMEKSYNLRNVRTAPALDGAGLSATIYLGHRRIGAVHDHFDDGNMRFEFGLFTDRIVFEQYVETWWTSAGRDATCGLVAAEYACDDPSFVPSLQAKMGYWMKSMVSELASKGRARRAA